MYLAIKSREPGYDGDQERSPSMLSLHFYSKDLKPNSAAKEILEPFFSKQQREYKSIVRLSEKGRSNRTRVERMNKSNSKRVTS